MAVLSVRQPSGKSAELINRTSDWGISVSEAAGQKTAGRKAMAVLGFAALAPGSLCATLIPFATLLFNASRAVLIDIGIVGVFVASAVVLNALSRRGPKNALQIDYDASEVRLGSINPAGAFVRHKVCPLHSIHTARADFSDPTAPALVFETWTETATIGFAEAGEGQLAELAAQIQAAANAARAAPMRTRIVSRINGLEAGVREISRRVVSRVNSGFA